MAAIRVTSEMAGSVWKLLVAVGDDVAEGADLLLLESMKMEIPIAAPAAGRVAEIRVEEREMVSEGQLLLVLAR